MKSKTLGLKWKIFIYIIGFCLLMLVILWLFQTVFLEQFYTSIKLNEIQKEAESIAEAVESGDMDSWQNNVLHRGDLYVEIWAENDESQTVPGNYPERIPERMNAEQKRILFAETEANGGALTKQFRFGPQEGGPAVPPEPVFPEDGQSEPLLPWPETDANDLPGQNWQRIPKIEQREVFLYTRLVNLPDGSRQMLIITASITPVNATVQTLQLQLVYISAIMLVLAVAVALIISRWVARPIEKLNRTAKELGKGHYDVHFERDGYREISELGGTLDKAAKELSKTEALRRELIANVSHDLRTPLTLITGYAEMMRDLPGEVTEENMQVIIDESRRLTALVADLLDLSRLQSGTGEMHFENFPFTAEVRDILARFSKFSEAEGFAIEFEADRDVTVCADQARIAQVVYNFLTNAMTHGGDEKSVLVRQTLHKSRVKLEVKDTGKGIAPEDVENIWDRYYKTSENHKRPAGGAGLGLSIVKSILEAHPDVEYGVESTPGKGSAFWFSLPVVAQEG